MAKFSSNFTLCIIQARTSSTRLPGKVLLPLGNKPMLLYQLDRVKRSRLIDKLVVATSTESSDDFLSEVVEAQGFSVFRGDLNDVLDRFYACAKLEQASTVVRLTGDCPLSDWTIIDEIIESFECGGFDYLSNAADEDQLSLPDGFDVEVFNVNALERAFNEAILPSEREHVTPWMRTQKAGLKWSHFIHNPSRRYYRVTVDDVIDLNIVRSIVSALHPLNPFLE